MQRQPLRSGPIVDHLASLRSGGETMPDLHPIHMIHQDGRGLADVPLPQVNIRMIERAIGAYRGSLTCNAMCRAMLEDALVDLGCSGFGLTTPHLHSRRPL
jgi:hypothetical protein